MIDKVRATIKKYNMLDSGDIVVAGVSGGADSVALLHVLICLSGELGIKIIAAHLNHKLRGDESDRDEAFVKNFCRQLGAELEVEAENVAYLAKERGLSLEEAGRGARYDFFSRVASGFSGRVAKIAVAHSLGDSVETLLLNLARGSALRGLSGIPPKRGNIIRPLIERGRQEIEAYCAENGLPFVIDSSNLTDDFARNKIRRHVIPALLCVNSGFWRHAAATLEALRADADFLDALAENELSSSRERYLSLGQPVRYRVLSKMLSQRGVPVDGARLARLDGFARLGSGAEQLSDKCFFKSNMLNFEIEQADESVGYFCVPAYIPEMGETREINIFLDKKLRLINTDYEYYEENMKYIAKDLKNALDYDKINGSLVLRQKLPGDRYRPSGRNCTKTLRKLFQERKLTARHRERLFILADDSGIIWAEGFGAAERAAVSEKTERVLILEIVNGEGHEL